MEGETQVDKWESRSQVVDDKSDWRGCMMAALPGNYPVSFSPLERRLILEATGACRLQGALSELGEMSRAKWLPRGRYPGLNSFLAAARSSEHRMDHGEKSGRRVGVGSGQVPASKLCIGTCDGYLGLR